MHEKPTSFDIAFLAGVSQPTVSRALRGSPVVSLETRKRIEEIARQLNYRVDKNASNLRSQHSNTLALLLFEDPTPDDSQINPFFLSMLGSITRASARQGYDLLISFQQLSRDWQQDYEDSRKADGIILLGYGDYEEYRPRLERLVEQGTHFVRWGPVLEGQPGISVGCDNAAGRLRSHAPSARRGPQGHRVPRHRHQPLSGVLRSLSRLRARHDGSRRRHLLRACRWTPSPPKNPDFRRRSELLARGVEFDAIVAASDLIAIGALRALQEAGIDVPRQVGVVGFDDIPAASLTNPPLTTVMQDTRRAGELLVETLLRQIAGDAAANSVIPTRLVVRKSG